MFKVYVDIGNSSIKIKLSDSDDISRFVHVDDIGNAFFNNESEWFISSVNGITCEQLIDKLNHHNIANTTVNYDILQTLDLGFKIDLEDFTTIGIDRVLDTAYSVKKYGYPVVIIDMGTANTYNFVDEKGVFKGGVITPGLQTRLHSLNSDTANLPKTTIIDKPYGVCHSSTIKAINSGVYFGLLGELKELIAMYGTDNVVISGGCSGYYYEFIQTNDYKVVDNLIVRALEELFRD